MVNLTYPEIAEITNTSLPPASLDALKSLRNRMCEGASGGFKLQSQQRFLRRVLSPDSPLRNLMMVHGTGVGKSCSAIQVSEEYILRPEYQDKKVLVLASRAVEENFRKEIFDIDRTNIDVIAGIIESKQCTGRRYLEMLTRIESEPKNWNNPDVRDKLESTANKLINEFYEFSAYNSFGIGVNKQQVEKNRANYESWIHETFDNRLLIVDEAHRVGSEEGGSKEVSTALESIVKIADGLVLVLMTATPMFDRFDEIVYYMNLFLWNDRKQKPTESVRVPDFFNSDGTLKEPGDTFRAWCQNYISFVRGENPFTFPFRLPPPTSVNQDAIKTSFLNKAIGDNERLKYIRLVESKAQGIQLEVLTSSERTDNDEKRQALLEPTVSVLPDGKSFREVFRNVGKQVEYTTEAFLTPSSLPNHSAKFVRVIDSIERGKGIALVYSNYATMGARLFAMALEEHGYSPAQGLSLLAKSSYSGPSKGKYILLTSRASDSEISDMLAMVKSPKNRDGDQVRVIISSPIVSEGVDFRCVRQIHVLDPWWNMSRIEQVIGRGLRTCSHKLLPFDEQNCTVYLHVVRTSDGRETFDEYSYRTKVEQKAMRIANVRKVLAESAMDCPVQNSLNTLPEDWKNLDIPQKRSESAEDVVFRLQGMLAPTFSDTPDVPQCIVKSSQIEADHVRPLSTFLDVRDELLEKTGRLLIDKPIWDRKELLAALRPYTQEVVIYNLQQAISSGFRFKDSFGRPSVLESRGELYALAPLGIQNGTLIERTSQPPAKGQADLPDVEVEETEETVAVEPNILDTRRQAYKGFTADILSRFSDEVLNGYVFDHELTLKEKTALLKSTPQGLPFADRLFVPDTEIIVLGASTFEPPEIPIGSDQTRFSEWKKMLVTRFIENKDKLFGSMKNGKFTISKMTVQADETVKRKLEKTAKKFEPITCGTGEHKVDEVKAFARFINKEENALPTFKNATEACMYAELLCREEHNCFWLTPEELSVLFETDDLKKQFTQAFKK